jgi:hypothetical protein
VEGSKGRAQIVAHELEVEGLRLPWLEGGPRDLKVSSLDSSKKGK